MKDEATAALLRFNGVSVAQRVAGTVGDLLPEAIGVAIATIEGGDDLQQEDLDQMKQQFRPLFNKGLRAFGIDPDRPWDENGVDITITYRDVISITALPGTNLPVVRIRSGQAAQSNKGGVLGTTSAYIVLSGPTREAIEDAWAAWLSRQS